MRSKHIIFGLIILVVAIGCRKREEAVVAAEPVAGKGGKSKLILTAKHYEKQLDSCTFYLKYNTLTEPKIGVVYDDSANVKNVNGRFQVTFDSLKQGKYFIHCIGRDLTLVKPNDSLWGNGSVQVVDTFKRDYDMYINTVNWYDHDNL
jgi:hypothetical protein